MSAAALIKFTQGVTVGPNGQMIVGTTGNFTVSNSDDTDIESWQVDLVYVPPGSSLSVSAPYQSNDSSPTPSVTIDADVTGCYRLVLKVWDVPGRAGPPTDTDIRVFGIPETNGTLIPPAQLDPEPLDDKPDEFNLSGNLNGWAGNGVSDGLLNHTLKRLDALLGAGAGASGPNGLAVVGDPTSNVHYEAVSQGNGDLVVWYIADNMTGNINAFLDNPPIGTTAKIKARFAYFGIKGGGANTHAVSIFDGSSSFIPVGGGNNSILEGQIYTGHYTWIDFEWFSDGSGYKWHSTASFQNP